MWNVRVDEAQAGIKIAGRNIDNLKYTDDITLMTVSEEELKAYWWKWKRRVKSLLKSQHSKNEWHPVPSWQINWERMESVTDFIFLGSKITADGDCSHEIKRHLLLGRKAMPNLVSILKSRKITLPTNVRLVKGMVFLVVMYGCESWTIKKTEHRIISAFELWCWRKPLFFLLFIYFNWKLITLQYCGSLTWIWESLGLQRDQTTQP